MCGLNVIMPLFVQSVTYHNATTSGLVLLPATIVMIVFNFIGPLLANKIGVRKVLIASCIFSIVGYLVMMTYDVNSSINYMILTQVLRAIGAGLGLMPAVTWTIAVVSGDVEDATAINNTVRQIIGAIGSALAVVLMAVFVPVSFMSGITGQMFRQFAICIATSIGLSTVVALTLSPALCAMILKSGEEKSDFEVVTDTVSDITVDTEKNQDGTKLNNVKNITIGNKKIQTRITNDLKGEVVYNIGMGGTPDLLLKYFLYQFQFELFYSY